jgi:hypothetical protein
MLVSVLLKSLSADTPGFRVSSIGVVLDVDRSTEFVKELKLTGVPYKIFKNTDFIIKICFRVRWKSLNLKELMFELFLGLMVK